MILHLQMGTVSSFTDFLSILHVTKHYSVLLYHPRHVLFCSVLEQQMPFFFSLKAYKAIQILQSLTEHVLCLCLDIKGIMTL